LFNYGWKLVGAWGSRRDADCAQESERRRIAEMPEASLASCAALIKVCVNVCVLLSM
jgi:hypothetical protein